MLEGKLQKNIQYELFLLPALILYSLFTIFPLLKATVLSFTDFDGYNNIYHFIGFKNYVGVFKDIAIVSGISFTVLFTILSILIITPLAISLAILFDQNFMTRNIHKSIFFFPSIPSGLLLGYIWGYILSPIQTGVVNGILHRWFHAQPVAWLSDPLLAKLSTLIVAVWTSTGWHAILYLAFLQSIPKDYYEAATIDGASWWQKTRYITLPMLAPGMTISVMLLMTGGLKMFELPLALTNGGPGFSTYTITQVIVMRGITEVDYGLASAMSIVFFLIILVLTYFQVTTMQKREEHLA